MFRIAVVAGSLLLIPASACFAQPFEDDGTQYPIANGTMHVCKKGGAFYPMVGAHVNHNWFMCGDRALGQPVIDAGTQGQFSYNGSNHSVHVCPQNMVMVGLHASNNLLACSQYPEPLPGVPFPDLGTQINVPDHSGNAMHGCPAGDVMVGIHVSDNVLICKP
jgi:hypothetical protein